jgi:hypothetical protein
MEKFRKFLRSAKDGGARRTEKGPIPLAVIMNAIL